VRDLWMHKELGRGDDFSMTLKPHASVLLKVTAH